MPLFQRAVRDSFIARLDADKLEQAFQVFVAHFGNPTVQENILAAKEEQYQEGFLNDLFVRVLGYTLNPQPQFNLITELKNVGNAGKADAAILRDGLPIAVIELKSAKVTNLQIVEAQAFAYKSYQPTARFVITSNFRLLRLYLDNAVEFEAFDLFALSADKTAFAQLYVCLHAEQLLLGKTESLKTQSVAREAQITQKLYACYSQFKEALFENLRSWNKQHDALTLYKKSQKLLDRFLFICFAEDKGLLPHNTIHKIIKQWEEMRKWKLTLYSMFTQQFHYLNDGYESAETPTENIFAYNGGLFAPDAELDALTISDDLLAMHLTLLSDYDFNSEVDTNILGHIFEHSLNELDEKTARVVGKSLDKAQSKRKKDGIFYTPTYITQFIVEQTLGEACRRRQRALGIDRLDWWESCPSAQALMCLHTYRGWLLQLTVVDPACGSGAFLNQAFIRLLAEHHTLDGMFATIQQTTYAPTQDWATYILDHNLFGVDINEESVEIAKLSLWLRTAQIGRKLNDLGQNILCGNSLMDDPAMAGNLAFDWQQSFPQVFQNGGFDVVIGNPPYVRHELLGEPMKNAFSKVFPMVYNGTADLYVYFYVKSIDILKEKGLLGFITPNKWLERKYAVELRNYLKQLKIEILVDFGELPIFKDASTEPAILILSKQDSTDDFQYASVKSMEIAENSDKYEFRTIQKMALRNDIWRFTKDLATQILEKFHNNTITLKEYTNGGVYYGIKTGFNKAFIIDQATRDLLAQQDAKATEILRPEVEGEDFGKWHLNHSGKYMITTGYDLDIPKRYPSVFKYLQSFENELIKRQDKGKNWYNLRACVYYEAFEKPKLIYYHTALNHHFYYDTEGYYISANCYFISNADRYLQCVLNSKLFHFCKKYLFPAFGDVEKGGRVRLDANKMSTLPIKNIDSAEKLKFQTLAEQLTRLTAELHQKRARYLRVLTSNFTALTMTKSLETWYDLDFGALRRELTKQKQSFAIRDLLDQQDLFEGEKARVLALQQQIAQLQQQMEQEVYALYALAPHEIALIEKS